MSLLCWSFVRLTLQGILVIVQICSRVLCGTSKCGGYFEEGRLAQLLVNDSYSGREKLGILQLLWQSVVGLDPVKHPNRKCRRKS